VEHIVYTQPSGQKDLKSLKYVFEEYYLAMIYFRVYFNWGVRRIYYLHIGYRIMVWLGGRIGERPDKLDFGWGS
jgi:hypothetical protein